MARGSGALRLAWGGAPMLAAIAIALSACGGGGGGVMPEPMQMPSEPAPQPKPTPPTVQAPQQPAPPAPEPTPPPPPPPPPPPAPPPCPSSAAVFENHPEYSAVGDGVNAHYYLRSVKAACAYARIQIQDPSVKPGAGVTIAIIDTGLDTGILRHWEFEGAQVSNNEPGCCERDDTWSHGTMVAGVIVAQRGNAVPSDISPAFNFHGAAWGAAVKMFPIRLGTGGSAPYNPITPLGLASEDMAIANDLSEVLADPDIDIVNMSFGYRGLIENYDGGELQSVLDDFIRVAAQGDKAERDKVLLVRSAGNHNGNSCNEGTDNCVMGAIDATSPSVVAGLPVYVEELRSHWVAVAGIREDGEMYDASNRCGIAAEWCIAAPGEAILVPLYKQKGSTITRSYGYAPGTSFAAPLVAAGLALVKQYFRDQIGNDEVLTRLLESARVTPDDVPPGGQCPAHLNLDGDLSDCELSSATGRGVMDLDAATRPMGPLSVALGASVAGARVPASASVLRGGAAFGDGLAAAMGGRELALFDELGAPFWVDLGGFAAPASRPGLASRLGRLMAPAGKRYGWAGGSAHIWPGGGALELPFATTRLRLAVNRAQAEGDWGHMGLAPLASGGVAVTGGEQWQVSAFASSRQLGGAEWQAARAAGALLAWRPQGHFGARLGLIREFDGALGADAAGAFGALAADTAFAGADVRAAVLGWRLSASAELGLVAARARPGLVRGISRLATSALSLSGERVLEDGGLVRLSLSRPLRVERGRLQLSIPSGRDRRGTVLRQLVDAPLRPSGHQLDVGAVWHRPAGAGELRLGSTLSLQPGHVAANDPELSLLAGWRLPF